MTFDFDTVNLEMMLYSAMHRYRRSHPGEGDPVLIVTRAFVEASLPLQHEDMPQGYLFGQRVMAVEGQVLGVLAINRDF